jgi:D-beta-D-heptose 7-phosphate kinase/D-beta-D-heptose 1-phosphate adenosyltransferase
MITESLIRLLDGFHSARVLVLGDVMLDHFVYGTATRISPEAPIPVVSVERISDMPGGAANVARNIAHLGAHVILLGVVGQDSAAEDLRGRLAAMPTIRACLIGDASRPTTLKTRYVADGQQVMRADRESVAPLSADVAEELLDAYTTAVADADLVVLSDYAKGVLSGQVTRAAIDAARRRGKTVIVDPKSRDFARYQGATIITPNMLELQQACGASCETQEQVVQGARRFIERGICETMVVTRGKDGISVVGREGQPAVHLPAAARQVFDVSGAGDTVVAVLSLGIIAGADVVDAAYLANIAAGIVVGKRGTATVATSEIVTALTPSDGNTDPLKIFSLDSAQRLVRGWREQGLKVAFTNGCFDLLHPGHISLLEQARRTADRLVVGLNDDMSISRLKGPTRPVQGEIARATVLAAVKSVDAVVIFAEDTPIQLIEALRPDVLVKGADYTVNTVVGADLVIQWGGKVVLADLLAGHSTSDTVKRVASLSTP